MNQHNAMPIKHILLAITVAIIWGCNFMFIKLGVQEVPPLFLCAARFLLAAFPAIFFIKRPAVPFKFVALYGLILFGLQFALLFSGIAVGMSAGMASVLLQAQVFFSIFFAALYFQERPNKWQVCGAIAAISGILLIAMHVNGHMSFAGFVLVLCSALAWSIGTLITKKMHKVNIISLIVWGSLVACFPLFVVSFLIEGQEKIILSLQHFSWITIVALFYIVYLSTWLGYGIWNFLLYRYPIPSVTPFTLLVPIVGLLSSTIFLGETLEIWKIYASLLVISGLMINLLGQSLIRRRLARYKAVQNGDFPL